MSTHFLLIFLPVLITSPWNPFKYVCFFPEKLSGMNESSLNVDIPGENCDERILVSKIQGCASVGVLPRNSSSNFYRFSGSTISSGVPVLITVDLKQDGKASKITVNCEKMTINSILAKELVAAVKKVS